MKTLHPFQRVFSASGHWRKPHCFMHNGHWYRLEVPCDVHHEGRHARTGYWLREMNARNGQFWGTHVDLDDRPAKVAIAKRCTRHHGR